MTKPVPLSLLLLLACLSARAQAEGGPQADLSGSVRGGYFGTSRKLDGDDDVLGGALWLKGKVRLDGVLYALADGWVRNDSSFHAGRMARLREAYIGFGAGAVNVTVGRQIIVWGRADGLNPTDNLSSRDYTLLTPESDDQRRGAMAAKLLYQLPDQQSSLTAIGLTGFEPNTYAIAPAPGVSVSEHIPNAGGLALKYERSGGAVDWSLSLYHGRDLTPDIRIAAGVADGSRIALEHNRIRVLGADAATVLGRYGLRAEAAYTWTEHNRSDNPLVKRPYLYAVAGFDRTFYSNLNLNLQYYFRRIASYRDPRMLTDPPLRAWAIQGAIASNEMDRVQHGISIRLGDKWLHETLEAEIAGVFSLTRNDYTLKSKVAYAFSDRLKGTVGFDIYRGSSYAYFGQLRDISSAYAELKYSF